MDKKRRQSLNAPVIPHKLARDPSPSFLRASAHALRMTQARVVILSAAKDLSVRRARPFAALRVTLLDRVAQKVVSMLISKYLSKRLIR